MANPAGASINKYIPAGCLVVRNEAYSKLGQWWLPLKPDRWHRFLHPGDQATDQHLPPNLQETLLLHSLTLSPFSRLFAKRWLQLEFRVSTNDPARSICRVYLLPDDVDRRSIPRSDSRLRKDLQLLLSSLDYSKTVWNGQCGELRSATPSRPAGDDDSGGEDGDEPSLLQMFNTIPSPKPQRDLVRDPEYARAMDSLLMSKVPGLKTSLYGYQARSAATMLQREVSPGQVLDPRLVHVLDQEGNPWYYDDITGTVLKEPRRYDGISGGILAEEMGTGKTLICLALILATKAFPAEAPDIHRNSAIVRRQRVGSLADMAAATITRESVPWKLYLEPSPEAADDYEYTRCIEAIERHRAWYLLPYLEARRETRKPHAEIAPEKIFLSNCTLLVVPRNLVSHWVQEIHKYTTGLKFLVVTGNTELPPTQELLVYDAIIFSTPSFERLKQDRMVTRTGWVFNSPLASMHFKRVIVDEGHRLGNSKLGKKSDILLVLDCLKVSARWVVTGTPSTGLFGVEEETSSGTTPTSEPGASSSPGISLEISPSKKLGASSGAQERKDLERIGGMAGLYLRARPWANTLLEDGDTPADWSVYVMQPKHSNRSSGRRDCLRATLDSLIIRHRRSEVSDLLPPVDEKVIFLDGSYQDSLCLNLFSMMIIFNAVQSQRTDQDYFFHPSQRSSLLLLLSNIQQCSFFGGYFYLNTEIAKAIETAEKFLEEKSVTISQEDERLLRDAIALGHMAMKNHLKQLAGTYHEVPIYVKDFPGGGKFAKAWSLDGQEGDLICTNAPMIHALQMFVRPCIDAPHSLSAMFYDGRFAAHGDDERTQALQRISSASQSRANGNGSSARDAPTLAGNTKLGENGSQVRRRSGALGTPARMEEMPAPNDVPETEIAEPLARAQIVSTASAKLSYLIDSIVRYQNDEQIIVFYEHETVAFYLAEHLEILQIHHLIYAKSLTAERRAQYVDTFNCNPKFRVLLMDISQAAFGLDMRSASRVYFINPVLNPQVEAQAIGRVRRISQKKQVSVETLVLRGSLEEVIMERRGRMTQAEHRKLKSILDDKAIYEWILDAKIRPLPENQADGPAQMAPLKTPQFLFGRGFGRVEHPDEGLVTSGAVTPLGGQDLSATPLSDGQKRALSADPGGETLGASLPKKAKRPRVSVRFMATPEPE